MKPLLEFFVAGLIHGDWDLKELRLRKGDKLVGEHEAANPFDSNAMRLDWKGKKLGYVPKDAHEPITDIVRAGPSKALYRFYVLNFAPTNPTHRMVLVGVFPKGVGESMFPQLPERVESPGTRRLILT